MQPASESRVSRLAARRARVKSIFNAALSHRPEDRSGYLAMVTAGSASLAREVSRYLKHFHQAGSALEPETAAQAAFKPGELVAERFRIVRLIGRGGMGEVFEAIDLVLRLPVALKTIRPDFAADAATQARFFSELQLARLIAHPNVCRTHELWREVRQDASPVVFLTMELLEGETLADLLKRQGALAPGAALLLLDQLAAALAAIHQLNVIHRDLKPSNVHVVPTGNGGSRVVVTDFGLARAVGDPSLTSTFAGTPAYMAPERFEGVEASVASDVYSFGVICFEMLTGQRHPLVPPRSLQPALDQRWEDLILTCVAQDSRKRPARIELVQAELALIKSGSRPVRARTRRLAMALTACFAAVVLAAVAMTGSAPTPSSEFTRLTFDSGLSWDPTASADGRRVVYSSDRGTGGVFQVWLMQFPGGEPIQLTHTTAHAVSPAISSDGQLVAFRGEENGGGVYLVPTTGGTERLVAPFGRHPRLSPDGRQIAYWTGVEGDHALPSGKLWVVDTAGGTPRQLHPELIDARFPAWSPDGKRILFRGSATPGPSWDDLSDWWITDAAGRSAEPTNAFARLNAARLSLHDGAIVWENSRVLFSARAGHSTNLWSMPISDSGRIMGAPERLTSGSNLETSPWPVAGGLLAYTNWGASGQIWRVWTAGEKAGQAEPLTQTDALDTRPSVSADGTQIIFTRRLGEARNLWAKNLVTGKESLVVAGTPLVPSLSPSGREIAYSLNDGRTRSISVIPTAGGKPRTICEDCGDVQGWWSDESAVLYVRQNVGGPATLEAKAVATGRVRVLVRDMMVSEGSISPSGDHVAFAVRKGGTQSRIFVAPLPADGPADPSTWRAVTEEGEWADKPRWSPDGKGLYFYSGRDGFGCIWRQPITNGLPNGPPTSTWHLHDARRAVLHLSRQAFAIAVGPDFVAYNVPNASGNLWLMSDSFTPRMLDRVFDWLPEFAR